MTCDAYHQFYISEKVGLTGAFKAIVAFMGLPIGIAQRCTKPISKNNTGGIKPISAFLISVWYIEGMLTVTLCSTIKESEYLHVMVIMKDIEFCGI